VSKLFRAIGSLLLLFVLALPVLAQGSLIYHDDASKLNRSRVQQAAAPLISRGASVAAYTVESGNETDFQQRLQQDGLADNSGGINPNTIAIYVSYSPRYSAIRFGDRWNAALNTNNNYESIRTSQLNAGLQANDATGGFVNAFSAIDRAIANPPTAGGGTTVNVGSGTFLPIVLLVIFLVVLFVAGPLLWRSYSKRRAATQAFDKARQAAEEARRQAGIAIADMGQAVKDARDKAQYDKLSYTPADVEQITRTQRQAEELFANAQEQFDQIGEALAAKRTPAQEDYTSSAQAYSAVAKTTADAQALLAQAEARRAELDKVNAAAPGEVDRAKKALADVAERLSALGDDFAQPQAILQPVEDLVARAESLLAEHRAADAITAAQAASAMIAEHNDTLTRYNDIRESISTGRAAAEQVAAQGYQIEAGLRAFNTAEGVLRQAAAAMERQGTAAHALLDQAAAARDQGVARGGGMPALRHENDERLPRVEQAGEQLATQITAGRQTFDQVDEFAESTWSDIRGNGSEAEAAAARARALWQRATQRNSMDAQDFLGAKEDLDAAEEQLTYARSLIDTITQRLKDLETARDAARQEIAAAQADIEKGWSYIHSNDPDIGKVPEEALTKATAQLEQATVELTQARPNWLMIVKQAQEANRLADEALAEARGEVETMGKLRDQALRAQQLATAEVQKIVQFNGLHNADLPPTSVREVNALQSDVQTAYQTLKAAEQSEEQTRADALRSALTRYTALQSTAEQLYGKIYTAFQTVDKMRKAVAEEAQQAQRVIERVERLLQLYSSEVRPRSDVTTLLDQARTLLKGIGTIRDEDGMKAGLAAAKQARSSAERAEQILRDQVNTLRGSAQRNDGLGDFVAGAVIGSLLNSGGRGHGSGWGGSWGGGGGHGGGGGGGWGGGGGGGGSWGGGGGGGSFGGGGGGGGGW
jgi:hypothetical protein